MNILITGIHGFVGSNLVAYLKSRHTIYGLDIVAPEKEGVVKTFSWDDMDAGKLPEVDAIVHLAGKAHDTKNKSAAEVYFKVNTGLTEKVYDYFLKSSAKKFVFFSTAKAAADSVEGILTEDVVPSPVGPYGESKIKAEEYILSHPSDEKQVYILRPCMIHGPGNKGNLNLLYGVVSKGIPWPLGSFENRRTFTSVGNICFAVEGLLTKDVASGIYNMGDDEALSTNELIEEICGSLGKKSHIWKLPKGLMTGVARFGGWLHLPLNPDRLQKLTESYISSNAKIKKALGVDLMPVSAREGLRLTLNSFKK
ncbi:MAG: NAD-dependent epimerase/dehydratase family protein [Bacteroidales bacterium]|nr:NAD-dependent epimerase/dehydratase family protein [Bacteroidales bacterium]MBR4408248.1 NAD-dependent epimerase/dehydratase family protein [Bacteroidales bacterium]